MSGPIVPPLEVTEVDGSPDGRPITKIIVSNGDLSISGREATIDTSGSSTTPGGADTQVQYNNAGAFGGAADFTFTGIGGTDPTLTITNSASDVATFTQKSITLDGGTALPTIDTTTGDDGLQLITGTHSASGPRVLLDAVSSPSVLDLTNNETDGTINISTTAGTGEITVNANGDLNLYGDSDSVVLRHQSGGSVYAKTATDEDAILGITAAGTGTPRLDIQSASNRVWVLCDANKKLKIQGGSGGDTWVFDASSATGGVTFPDGTEQTTAATGGGGIVLAPAEDVDTSYDVNYITSQAPYGNCSTGTFYFSRDEPFYYPFLAPSTGNLAGIVVDVTSAAGSACDLEVAIYADSDGLPGAMLGKATFDVTSAAQLTQTSFTDDAGGATTIPTTANNQLWIGYVRVDAEDFTVRAVSTGNAAAIGPTENLSSSWKILWEFDTNPNNLPATVTKTDLSPRAYDRMSVGLEYD